MNDNTRIGLYDTLRRLFLLQTEKDNNRLVGRLRQLGRDVGATRQERELLVAAFLEVTDDKKLRVADVLDGKSSRHCGRYGLRDLERVVGILA